MAQREIDRLESEATDTQISGKSSSNRRNHDTSKKPTAANQSVNGTASASAELTPKKDAALDETVESKKAAVEDELEA